LLITLKEAGVRYGLVGFTRNQHLARLCRES
jgi:hypothetical protein